jgi:hypothetical protein
MRLLGAVGTNFKLVPFIQQLKDICIGFVLCYIILSL